MRKNQVIVDIGAATGDFTITAAKHSGNVHAWECDPNRLGWLHKNIVLAKQKNIIVHPQAAHSLDTVLKSIDTCDFLKVDCEGCEYEIFAKATATSLRKIKRIAMEIHFFDEKMKVAFPKLEQKLTNAGFLVTTKPSPVHSTIGYLFAVRGSAK